MGTVKSWTDMEVIESEWLWSSIKKSSINCLYSFTYVAAKTFLEDNCINVDDIMSVWLDDRATEKHLLKNFNSNENLKNLPIKNIFKGPLF